jgi:hypothetical protein
VGGVMINFILFRGFRVNRNFKKLELLIKTHNDNKAQGRSKADDMVAEAFLAVLLKLMALILLVNREYRKNIKDFDASYVFTDKSNKIYVTAEFKNNKLKIKKKRISEPDFTLVFRDGKTLFAIFLSESMDMLDSLLHQKVSFEGSVNYLNKFAYMAMRLKLAATGKLPKNAV